MSEEGQREEEGDVQPQREGGRHGDGIVQVTLGGKRPHVTSKDVRAFLKAIQRYGQEIEISQRK